MAATVLNSERAIEMSVFVVLAFVRMRRAIVENRHILTKLAELERRLENHDADIQDLMDAIRDLMAPSEPSQSHIGFQPPSGPWKWQGSQGTHITIPKTQVNLTIFPEDLRSQFVISSLGLGPKYPTSSIGNHYQRSPISARLNSRRSYRRSCTYVSKTQPVTVATRAPSQPRIADRPTRKAQNQPRRKATRFRRTKSLLAVRPNR